jgi:hypothetical protein
MIPWATMRYNSQGKVYSLQVIGPVQVFPAQVAPGAQQNGYGDV